MLMIRRSFLGVRTILIYAIYFILHNYLINFSTLNRKLSKIKIKAYTYDLRITQGDAT